MTVYTIEELTAMTYREIQAIAKTFSIAANKKKDDLVVLIASASANDVEEGVVEEEQEEVKVEPPTTEDMTKNSSEQEEASPSTNTDEVCEENITEVETQEEISNLTDTLSSVRLNGLPTPQGKKTIFEAETPVVTGTGYLVNWGLSFQSPAGKKTPSKAFSSAFQTPCGGNDTENSNPQYIEEDSYLCDDNYYTKNALPSNTHIHFFSPEVKTGSQVHWRYEDYDVEAQTSAPPVPPSTVRKTTDPVTPMTANKHSAFKSVQKKTPGQGILQHAAVPDLDPLASPMSRQESLMNFWLSKGTPGKALFR